MGRGLGEALNRRGSGLQTRSSAPLAWPGDPAFSTGHVGQHADGARGPRCGRCSDARSDATAIRFQHARKAVPPRSIACAFLPRTQRPTSSRSGCWPGEWPSRPRPRQDGDVPGVLQLRPRLQGQGGEETNRIAQDGVFLEPCRRSGSWRRVFSQLEGDGLLQLVQGAFQARRWRRRDSPLLLPPRPAAGQQVKHPTPPHRLDLDFPDVRPGVASGRRHVQQAAGVSARCDEYMYRSGGQRTQEAPCPC